MKHYKIATIILYTKKLELYIQDRRSMSKFGEEWGFFGGSIEKGETPRQAAIREIKEELDYELKDFEKVGKLKYEQVDNFISDIHIFSKKITKDDIKNFTVLEGDGGELVSLDKLKNRKMMLGMDKIINMFKKKLLNKPGN